jgi:hypothetical protein
MCLISQFVASYSSCQPRMTIWREPVQDHIRESGDNQPSRFCEACFKDSQFPARMPMDLALFTRWMPAASSGANRPLSVAYGPENQISG